MLHNHANKESLTVCKSCFRTVEKNSNAKRLCSTSIGAKRKKRTIPKVRFPDNLADAINRNANTARETHRTRNIMRDTKTAKWCGDRAKRIKESTTMINTLLTHEKVTRTSDELDVDFNLFKIIQDSLKLSVSDKDKESNINYWPNHKGKRVEYILWDEKLAICSDCLFGNVKDHTKVLSVSDTIERVRKMLMEIENDSIRIIQNKNQYLKEIEHHGEFIQHQKTIFIDEQKSKIEQLHKYLDDKLSHIVSLYNERIEKDLLQVYNTREIMSWEIKESLRYLRKLQEVLENMDENNPKTVIEDIVDAGVFLKKYKKLKELSIKDAHSFKNTFTVHQSHNKPAQAIDLEEEIQILKSRFDELNYGIDKRGDVSQKLIKPLKDFPKDNIKRVPQTRKIYLPRWLSKTVAEYDVDAEETYWEISECKTDLDFFPFCSFAYLPNYHILSIGGLNNKIPKKQMFSSRVVKIMIENLNIK